MYEHIIVALFILFFFILPIGSRFLNSKPEHFGSHQVDDFLNYKTGRTKDNIDLIRKYSWSEKNNLGENIYDKFYQDVTHNRIYGSDHEYAYREIGTFATDGVYDTKFSTLSDNELSNFTIPEQKIGTSITYHGNKVNLSQYEDNRRIPRSVFGVLSNKID